jgi:hypothetical protein
MKDLNKESDILISGKIAQVENIAKGSIWSDPGRVVRLGSKFRSARTQDFINRGKNCQLYNTVT